MVEKGRNGQVALLLAGILVVSLGITALTGTFRSGKKDGTLSVVASFYPMYTAALRVVGNTPGVAVSCLTQPVTGCLHDYQLSPAEMAVLTGADVLVLNGAGAESFLEQALTGLPSLIRIDTSAGLTPEEGHEHEEHGEHEGHDHEESLNEHLWVSPSCYAAQIANLREGLIAADPAHTAAYRENAAAYLSEIAALDSELAALAGSLTLHRAVLFHDSMAYLAHDLGLSVIGHLPLGEEQGTSAAELAEVADAVRGQEVLFLYDSQYPADDRYLADYAARSAIAVLDSAVKPQNNVPPADAWLHAMRENLRVLQEAAT